MSPLFRGSDASVAHDNMNGASANGASAPSAPATDAGVRAGVVNFASERPEIAVAAAFVGGLALAMLARRLAR